MKKTLTLITILLTISTTFAQDNDYNNNGLYIDGFIGGGSFTVLDNKNITSNFFSIGAKLGSKFYLKQIGNYHFGLQAQWARVGFSVGRDNFFDRDAQYDVTPLLLFDLIPLNVGYASYFAVNEKMGLEANLNVGPGFEFGKDIIVVGIHVNPQVKFRYKKFALGFDISILNGDNVSYGGYWVSKNSYSLSVGTIF